MHGPTAVARAAVPALGGHQHVVGGAAVGGQCLGHDALAVAVLLDAQRVGVGGVDDGDAGIERGVDSGDGLGPVGPTFNGERHLAQADGADRPLTDATFLHFEPPWSHDAARLPSAAAPHYADPLGTDPGRPRAIQSPVLAKFAVLALVAALVLLRSRKPASA